MHGAIFVTNVWFPILIYIYIYISIQIPALHLLHAEKLACNNKKLRWVFVRGNDNYDHRFNLHVDDFCACICIGVIVQPSAFSLLATEGGQAMVCMELVTGNLQRNVSVRAMTLSSTGSYMVATV